jgi:S-adenosylmethionine:tRNA ribosyltransferase-isomerase
MDTRKDYFNSINDTKHKLSDFYYHLPEELIAQFPLEERDTCQLLVLHRETKKVEHKMFSQIVDYLNPGDCLVLNDTRVFPARLSGRKDKTRAQIEIFLLRNLEGKVWEVLVKPARKVRIGNKIIFKNDVVCDVIDNTISGGRIVEFNCDGNFNQILDEIGKTPLPPYIKREPDEKDKIFYQTVYAQKIGAVAAPTAGLHFTNQLLEKIKSQQVHLTFITLHVGLGTFKPVQVDDISRHKMGSEYYEVNSEVSRLINETQENGGKIVAVGTTTVRVLETIADHHGLVRPGRGWTDKYIYPPYQFKVVDRLITNFHLPQSTLLMLVAAFTSVGDIKKAYQIAIEKKYRFFSYGDAMMII